MRFLILLFTVVLTACGGGGGGGATSAPPTSALQTVDLTPILHETSYKNAKSYPFHTYSIPRDWEGVYHDGPFAIGAGDFLKTGKTTLFLARQNYTVHDTRLATINSATDNRYLSDFGFFTINSDGTLTQVLNYKGCLHPRKAAVADYNKDGTPDVLVACHGYDADPWPGEPMKLLLSDGRGGFTMSDVGDPGFHHSASAADINGDGYPDILTSTFGSIHFYINQRNGTFVKDTTRIFNTSPPYFTVDIVDVNNDGNLDLLVGGHEVTGTSGGRILYGNNQGQFGVTYRDIPSVAGRAIVLDFAVIDSKLYISRTSDEYSITGSYKTQTIQMYDMNTSVSKTLFDTIGQWIPWFAIDTQNGVKGVVTLKRLTTQLFSG